MKLPVPRRRWTLAAGAAAVGVTAGIVLGGLGIANAASSTSSTASPSSSSSPSSSGAAPSAVAPSGPVSSAGAAAPGYGAAGPGGGAPGQGGPRTLPLSGTVTAVGSDSVTIKTSSATTTYAVTSSSDIDKNGEATLSDLKVGDAVTFSTTTSGSTVSIDKLHAGNDALDWPSGPPAGANGNGSYAPGGAPPAGSGPVA